MEGPMHYTRAYLNHSTPSTILNIIVPFFVPLNHYYTKYILLYTLITCAGVWPLTSTPSIMKYTYYILYIMHTPCSYQDAALRIFITWTQGILRKLRKAGYLWHHIFLTSIILCIYLLSNGYWWNPSTICCHDWRRNRLCTLFPWGIPFPHHSILLFRL